MQSAFVWGQLKRSVVRCITKSLRITWSMLTDNRTSQVGSVLSPLTLLLFHPEVMKQCLLRQLLL